ncbi:hypothetical protein [Phenylobacterium aquaticum]|uniref:hypothetical protein n=1 Tax=Phenylobacterium aquaticum TaxID=1763816 RepID=UPI0026F1BC6A|nr:hypothetical protein [Phenylobacterium aquaticum]
MRLSLIPLTAALLALGACDSVTRLAGLQAPPAAPACHPAPAAPQAAPACPTMSPEAPAPATATAVIEPYPAGPYVTVERTATRRVYHRVVAHRQQAQAITQVRRYVYARVEQFAGGPRPAPPYDGQVDVPERHAYARVDTETRYSESARYTLSEEHGYAAQGGGYQSSGYAMQGGGYGYGHAAGADCGCGPQPAAGRDRNGFLTWPGKSAARP